MDARVPNGHIPIHTTSCTLVLAVGEGARGARGAAPDRVAGGAADADVRAACRRVAKPSMHHTPGCRPGWAPILSRVQAECYKYAVRCGRGRAPFRVTVPYLRAAPNLCHATWCANDRLTCLTVNAESTAPSGSKL